MSEFKEVIIEGFDNEGAGFQEIITRDVVIDIPVEFYDGYGTNYGATYG